VILSDISDDMIIVWYYQNADILYQTPSYLALFTFTWLSCKSQVRTDQEIQPRHEGERGVENKIAFHHVYTNVNVKSPLQHLIEIHSVVSENNCETVVGQKRLFPNEIISCTS
jgi:hypothetical protein